MKQTYISRKLFTSFWADHFLFVMSEICRVLDCAGIKEIEMKLKMLWLEPKLYAYEV